MKNIRMFALLLSLLLLLCACGKEEAMPLNEEQLQQTEEPESEAPIEAEETVVEETAAVTLPMDLGQGLRLTALTEVAGNFPEDGSDEFVPSLLAATIENTNGQMIQYAEVTLTINGADYSFTMSTIPAGDSVRVFEVNKQASPESVDSLSGTTVHLALFDMEPSKNEDVLEITILDGGISVKNISDTDITGEISVFYKNVYGELFQGGITYRLRISGGLKAGETTSGYASHAAPGYSEIMFVTYG